MKDQSKDI